MAQIKNGMIKYISKEEIATMVSKLANQIEADYAGKEVVLICPLKGSILFAADLSRSLKLPQQIDFVQVTGGSTNDEENTVRLTKDISVNIGGKHVLIIEEIIDAGRTLNFLKNRLLASGPASLKIVTLLDKPARRVINIKPDYVGKTIEDRYVVGYGMDDDGLGRNYSELFYLKH